MYEISTRTDLTTAEAVAEYRELREIIAEDRWVSSFQTRLEDRATWLRRKLADNFVDNFYKKKTKKKRSAD
jgi:hypothetical protein